MTSKSNSSMTSTTEYKVNRILWESLESILYAHSVKYVREIAKKLEIPEKELIKRVIPSSDTLKVYIQDTNAETTQWKAYTQNDKLTVYCKKPVAYNCDYCAIHRHKRAMIIKEVEPQAIQKVKDRDDIDNIWITSEDKLINSNGDFVGKINKNKGIVTLYVVE